MHRFYLPPQRCQGPTLTLEEREAHHAWRVLRLQPGHVVTVLDGAGRQFQAEITSINRRAVQLLVRQVISVPPPPFQLTLVQAIPKGKLMDFIIQKATELGVTRIVPLISQRVVTHLDQERGANRSDHWRQVAVEAVKQCGSAWLPAVEAPLRLQEWCARAGSFELSLLGSLEPGRRHARDCFESFRRAHGALPRSASLCIGPEGDFTPQEVAALKSLGTQPVSLGRLVLRAETAALCGLAVLNYEWEAQHALAPEPENVDRDVPGA